MTNPRKKSQNTFDASQKLTEWKSKIPNWQVTQWPQIKSRFTSKLLLVALYILNFLALGFVFINLAKPGDVLYFPKLVLEKSGGSAIPALNYARFTRERIQSLSETLAANSCVQSLVVEEEMLANFQKFKLEEAATDKAVWITAVSGIYDALLKLDLPTTCNTTIKPSELRQTIAAYIYAKSGSLESQIHSREITDRTNKAAQTLVLIRQGLDSAKPSNQTILNDINTLSLEVKNTIDGKLKGSGNKVVDAYTVELDSSAAMDLLEQGKSELGYIPTIKMLCLFAGAEQEICQPLAMDATFNSISFATSVSTKLEAGRKVYVDYLSKLAAVAGSE